MNFSLTISISDIHALGYNSLKDFEEFVLKPIIQKEVKKGNLILKQSSQR
jgi:hypothetical protein